MRRAFVGGTVIDAAGMAHPHTSVVVEGSRIVEVSQTRSFGSEVHVVDVAGKTIMPGLIDCHIHHAHWAEDLVHHQDRSLMLLAAETVHALKTTLEAGFTTVRDLGGLDTGFRDAIEQGLIPGPRVHTSVVIVSPTNGIVDRTTAQGMRSPVIPGMPNPDCNGPYEARAKIREVLRAGADAIKIATTGGVSSPRLDPRRPIFSRQEVEAIVDEAHMAGVPVVCHALGGPGLIMAIRAGVDTIEHGVWLDDECVAEMVERGTWYVPTFSVYKWHAELGPPFKQQRARAQQAAHLRSFALARQAGVRIALGSDAGGYGFGDNALELELLVEAGMTPGEALTAGTRRAAECLRLHDTVGTVEAGKAADLLVVDGDPLADVGVLRREDRRALIVKAGQIVGGTSRAA